MRFNYPKGTKNRNSTAAATSGEKPKKNSNPKSHSNRGMNLEEDINQSIEYYLSQDIASIHKKPTPIQIVKVDYPHRSAAVIKEAYFKTASTTDYNGVYKGKHIDFEAKETKNKTSFPLGNFHEHQIIHMKSVINQGGICFAIIRFTELNETYILDSQHIVDFWTRKEQERKSIPKSYIEEHGTLIKEGYHPRLDFIKLIDGLFL